MIIQFGPIRSGSTLIYNIIKEISPLDVKKCHSIDFNLNNFYICSVRHPFNSIASHYMRYKLSPSEKNIESAINEYLNNGGLSICDHRFTDCSNIKILKYEDFYQDIFFAIDEISKSLNLTIDQKEKMRIQQKFDIKKIKKICDQFKSFQEYCPKTHWHGNHVSKNFGSTNYFDFFSKKQIKKIEENSYLKIIINKFY